MLVLNELDTIHSNMNDLSPYTFHGTASSVENASEIKDPRNVDEAKSLVIIYIPTLLPFYKMTYLDDRG